MLQRTLGVLLAALLLMPASLGQALPPVPTALPGLPPLLPAMPRHQPAAPAEVRDRGLEAIGGPLELRQRREAMLAAGAAAPMAVPPAQAPREELQRVTFMEPRPTAPRAQAAAGDSDAEPAAGAPKSDPVEVHTRAAAAPMAATAAGYALSLSADVFPAGAQVSTTATLTRSGLPVAGATLSLGTADLTFTTDGAGTAAIAFAAPGSNTELPVTVTTADGALTEAPLASLFVVAPGYGAVVVEDAVDPAGNPITAFSIQIHYGNGGVYANFTETGTRGAIIRAGDGWVEVRADLADAGFLHHQAITVTGGARTAVHPSGSGMVRLQLQPTLTFGAALTQAEFSLHPDNTGYTSRADSFDGTDVYLQPGYYELMLLARFGTERVLEERSILVAGGPTVPMPIAVSRNDLTTATFRGQNGSGLQLFGWVEIGSLWTQIRLTDLDQPLLVDRGYGRPIRYGLELETETDWYRYTFDGDERYPRTTDSGPIEWILGAPLVSRLRHLNGYSAPGAILTYGTQLRTVHGDWVTVQRATKDPQSKLYGVFRDVPGTLRLKDGAGSTVTEAAIPTGWSETQVDLPADASGEYTAEAIYLPGPFHPEVVGVLSVPVYREPDYRLTLSKEIFQPGESGTVTAHLSVDGQPAAGATLQVGYGGSEGTFTTDTNGDATFTFTADWGGETPIDFTHNDHYGRPGYMYTVPEGYAVLIYTGATDQARAPVFDATVSFTTYSAAGGPYQRGAWVGRNSVFGAVRPAGVTDVELFSDYSPSGGSLYLHDRVTLTPG
ncbi:MAG TPA: hypothetical protein VNT01_12085, partial [Symbiobacteriaceae bacterium]|nr:hypothetical protein [Symbiobacteriaceae bacterium]